MTERKATERKAAERRDILPQDRGWFDRTCRWAARAGCRGRPGLWDDAEAEARVRAWRAYAGGRDRAGVALAALSGARNLWRAEGRRAAVEGRGEAPDGPDPAPGPESALSRLSVEALLAGLPVREACVLARALRGEDQRHIAAATGAGRQVVRKLYHRALGRLRASPEAQAWFSP